MIVSIVIPNWNGVHLLQKNLRKVIENAKNAEIVVCDDASSDGSVEFLKTLTPKVRLIARDRHDGFATTVNAGVEAATGEIIVLINTDVWPEENFLSPLLQHFKNPNVFAVGCLEKSMEKNRVVLRGRGLAGWKKGYFVHSRGEVDKTNTAWVSGGSGAFRKSIWTMLGGLDTMYNPFYWEDIDISYRARKSGFKILFDSKSVVWHDHDQGKIKTEFSTNTVKRISYRNQFIFIWKNLSDPMIIVSHIFWTPIRLAQALVRFDFNMISGYISALIRLPKIYIKRLEQSQFFKISDRDLNIWDK